MAQPYIGEIRMFSGNFPPKDWAFCDGQLLPISENEPLFMLIGTTYGGDGQSTFALPNLQSRVPIHMGNGPDGRVYQLAEMAGTEQETLTVQQIPNHTHTLMGSTNTGSTSIPENSVLAKSTSKTLYRFGGSPMPTMSPQTITPVGGSQPHENTQPFLCLNFIISLFGIYPQPT